MKNPILRILPALIFTGVAALAIVQHRDYVEAGIWALFALAVVLPALPASGNNKRTLQLVAVGFMVLGIILLVLRLLNILPVPLRPLS
ncbi:hypothetical protein I5M27_08560 [Adhaeribacter sp. BT258]|uniref:Uncharacterized protein n=1 Tax=Adhaeribacter terrigena TaxID=2793070 RepID=A0ABS1C0Z1_9BACT|nr:hypothetical protein [Adhaeribacter terrigena]MBK0403037.1 hypothetical protein [Adhaeribacter terrigena]